MRACAHSCIGSNRQKHDIYENSLVAMLIEGYGDPAFLPKLEQIVHYLVERQGEGGTWTYKGPVPSQFFPEPEIKEKQNNSPIAVLGGRPIVKPKLPEAPVVRTQPWPLGGDGDNSCTQFAALGLWSGVRAGIKVEPEVWQRLLQAMLRGQNRGNAADRQGGWGYRGVSSPYGSMTCAGICTTALAINQLSKQADIKHDLRIRNGLSWLARHFSATKNPESKKWEYYYIYSLERVGQIVGVDFVGKHEWYPLGARSLVQRQHKDGSWTGSGNESDPRLATAFALLFLTRATPELDAAPEPEPTGPGQLTTSVRLPNRTHRVYLILDASGSMLAQINGKRKFDIARQAVKELVGVLPPDTQIALRVYGHRKRAIEPGAKKTPRLKSSGVNSTAKRSTKSWIHCATRQDASRFEH